MDDRRVHAVLPIEGIDPIEVVRYDRSGKWWLEHPPSFRIHLTLPQAVAYVAESGATPIFGVRGGSAFDRKVRAAVTGKVEVSDG